MLCGSGGPRPWFFQDLSPNGVPGDNYKEKRAVSGHNNNSLQTALNFLVP